MYFDKELLDKISDCYFTVHKTLGHGFSISVYENAMMLEFADRGIKVKKDFPMDVFYKNRPVGKFVANIVVEDTVILELKAVQKLGTDHEQQLTSYLKATNNFVGMILNFGKDAHFRRLLNYPARDIQT